MHLLSISPVNGVNGWFAEHRQYLPFLKTDETPYIAMLIAYAFPFANLRQLEGLVIALSEC